MLNNIKEFISKHALQKSLIELLNNIEIKAPTNFTNLSRRIALGFKQYNVCVRHYITPKLNQEVGEFYCFISIFKRVIEKCSSIDSSYLIKRFKNECKNPDKLRGLYHELRTIDMLLRKPHLELFKLPEANLKRYQGNSPPDAIFKAWSLYFQLECKSISESKGHPIIREALEKFLQLLVKSVIYPTICPREKFCHIKFSFDGYLVSEKNKSYPSEDAYTPQSLLEKFEYELSNSTGNIIIDCSNDDDIINISMSEEEEKQSLSVLFDFRDSIVKHRFTLVSSAPNDFILKMKDLIDSAIQKKRKDSVPLILSFEIFDISYYSEWALITQVLLCEYKDEMLWFILTDREDKKGVHWTKVLIDGRRPIEVRTKALSILLELNKIQIGEIVTQ